jgi:hypothetical protein
LISDRHRCIFVHIPKCAGSSIEAVIWPGRRTEADLWMGFVDEHHNRHQTGGLQHLLASQIALEVGRARFDDYFKFSFVRNPFDRLVSQYTYMAKRPDLRAFVDLPEDASFSEYLDRIARREHVQWLPQHRFVLDDEGKPLVDFIGRFETFDDDAREVLRRIGIRSKTIPHRNRTERRPYREYYSEADRAHVEDVYAVDLERFGYEF